MVTPIGGWKKKYAYFPTLVYSNPETGMPIELMQNRAFDPPMKWIWRKYYQEQEYSYHYFDCSGTDTLKREMPEWA